MSCGAENIVVSEFAAGSACRCIIGRAVGIFSLPEARGDPEQFTIAARADTFPVFNADPTTCAHVAVWRQQFPDQRVRESAQHNSFDGAGAGRHACARPSA